MFNNQLVGETILYGQLLSVDYSKDNTISFRSIEGQVIECTTDNQIAKELADKIGDEIGLCGTVTWNIYTLKVDSFNVTGIAEYTQSSLVESFQDLSNLIGDRFDQIEEVNHFVSDLRC